MIGTVKLWGKALLKVLHGVFAHAVILQRLIAAKGLHEIGFKKSGLCLNEYRREPKSQQRYTDSLLSVLKDLQICFYIIFKPIVSHGCHI